MKCSGLHCDGCGAGGGWIGAIAVVVIIAIVAAPVAHGLSDAVTAAHHAADAMLHILLLAVEAFAIVATTAGVLALGVIGNRRRKHTTGQRREAERIRQAADRATVDAILRREQLQPHTWRAEVIRHEIPGRTGGQK